MAEQVGPAVAMGPDLVSIYAGANDILRPRVDIDALMRASTTRRSAGSPGPEPRS